MSNPITIRVTIPAKVVEKAIGLEIAKAIAKINAEGNRPVAIVAKPEGEIYGLPLV